MIKVRERWAKKLGYKTVITYTLNDNYQSFSHLIKLNYEMYVPEYEYADKGCLYFRKEL
jgi:hypothetical protein